MIINPPPTGFGGPYTVSVYDTDLLRNGHPHKERFYISVLRPTMVYEGTITFASNPQRGDRSITVSDDDGDITDIQVGQTLYVYDTNVDAEPILISKRRVRARVGQVITVDENNVPWVPYMTIKVVNNWELWSVFPYIDPVTLVFYKDRDVVYTDENTKISPVAIIDCFRAKFLSGTSVTFPLDGSRSYAMAVGATITSYAWECDGGTIANAAIATTSITFTTTGQYWLKLTVTDSNAKTQTLRFPIFVHSRTGVDAPYTSFELSDVSTSWNNGGANCSIDITGVGTEDEFPDESLLIIWSEQFYNGEERYISDNGNIVLLGYIQAETVKRDIDTGSVSLRIGSITELMKTRKMTSVSLEESAEVATWYRFSANTLTVARCVHHLLRWHSTLLNIANVFLPTSNILTLTACDDFENGTLYDMVRQFTYDNGIFANVCSSLNGNIHVEEDIMLADLQSVPVPAMVILGEDRIAETDIEFVLRTENVSLVYVSGIGKDADGKYVPLISACPGEIPDTFGESDAQFERQVLEDQEQANTLSGKLFAKLNSSMSEIRVELAGNYPVDVVPQNMWHLYDSDNKRLYLYSYREYVIRDISFNVDTTSGTRRATIAMEPEEQAQIGGITVDIPDRDPNQDPDEPNNPPFPPFPPFPQPPPTPPPPPPSACTDDSPNGPWNTFSSATILSEDDPITTDKENEFDIFYPCKLRAASSANPSSISITGSFLKKVDEDTWETNESNDWYHVYALDITNTILAEATMSGSGDVRTGVFLPASEISIVKIRIVVNPTEYDEDELFTYNFKLGDYAGDGANISPGINFTRDPAGSGFYGHYAGNDDCVGIGRPVLYPFGSEGSCGPFVFHSPKNTIVSGVGQFPITIGYTLYNQDTMENIGVYPHFTYSEGGTHDKFFLLAEHAIGSSGSFEYTFNGDVGFNGGAISGFGIHFTSHMAQNDNLQIGDVYFKLYTNTDVTGELNAIVMHAAFLYNICK